MNVVRIALIKDVVCINPSSMTYGSVSKIGLDQELLKVVWFQAIYSILDLED